jgi:DNA-binding LacI/PurR family transcriptional regulator
MATMQDVAELSGLSRYTVSKVLNGTPGVSQATRARVLETCRKLNFVTNLHAASLAKGGSRLMGLLVTSIIDPFYGEIIQTAEQTASSLGFELAYRCSYGDAEQERRIVQSFLGLKAAALVVSPVSSDDNETFWSSLAASVPVVFIDHSVLKSAHLVSTDHYTGGRLVTEHLLSRNVDPHYLGSSQPLRNAAIAARQRGYVEAMEAAGKAPKLVPTDDIADRSDTERFGYEALSRYLKSASARRLRGLWCATDAIALGAMRALADVGLEPGSEVLVAGHDDLPFSAFLKPALTTVRQPKRAIGEKAVHAAARLAVAKDPKRHAKIKSVLAPELVARESTLGPSRR